MITAASLRTHAVTSQPSSSVTRPGLKAGAWELLHATETGVARLPDKVAQIWANLNEAFWKLDTQAQASERQLVVRAFEKEKFVMKGSQLTLVPFSPPSSATPLINGIESEPCAGTGL